MSPQKQRPVRKAIPKACKTISSSEYPPSHKHPIDVALYSISSHISIWPDMFKTLLNKKLRYKYCVISFAQRNISRKPLDSQMVFTSNFLSWGRIERLLIN